MVSRALVELHIKVSLHFFVLGLLLLITVDVFRLFHRHVLVSTNDLIDFSSHLEALLFLRSLVSRLFSLDQVLEVHVFITYVLPLLVLATGPVLRKGLPVEVLRPLCEIEGELVSHVSWQSHEVVKVIRSVDTSQVSVGAHVERPYLIAAIDEISRWEDVRLFQKVVEIQDHNTPAVVFQLQWNLGHKSVLCVEVLEQVTD